jgi:hypothetical protein
MLIRLILPPGSLGSSGSIDGQEAVDLVRMSKISSRALLHPVDALPSGEAVRPRFVHVDNPAAPEGT